MLVITELIKLYQFKQNDKMQGSAKHHIIFSISFNNNCMSINVGFYLSYETKLL